MVHTGPTTAAASCSFAPIQSHPHHHQHAPFDEAAGGAKSEPGGGHSPSAGASHQQQQHQQPQMMEAAAAGDDFPEDLDGIPLTNLTGNTGLDGKVEPFFGFAQPPSVSSAHHQLNGGVFPSDTPSTSSDSALDHPNPNNGGARLGSCPRLVIRDPFDDDAPDQQNMAPPGYGWFPPPPRPPLDREGRPLDGRTWMDQVRANGGGEQRPLVPSPGNAAPVTALPQYAFYVHPMHKQRLETMYPPGTFSPTYFRTVPMPPPRSMMPMVMPRFVMMPLRPGQVLPPAMAAMAANCNGRFPVPVMCGPGGVPMAVFPSGVAMPIPHQMLMAAAAGVPPMGGPPGNGAPGIGPNQPQTPQQQAGPVNSGKLNNSGGSTTSSTTTTITGGVGGGKPKKETAKARKLREQQEKAAAAAAAAVEQQQREAAMVAAAASVGMPPHQQGRSPCEGFPPPPSHPMMMGPGPGMAYGAAMAVAPPQQQMCHPQQHQQQEAVFKVPGRSPSSLKRASLPPPPFPPGLLPMPEQRIQISGQCQACRQEITDQRKGIQCTAISQGCNRAFHWECAELTPEAFQEFCKDPRLEWICRDCYAQKGHHCVLAI